MSFHNLNKIFSVTTTDSFKVEIGMDSYRGSGKASGGQRIVQNIPHKLLENCNLLENFIISKSSEKFLNFARRLVQNIKN